MYKPSCYFQNPRHAPCHHFASPLLPRFQSRVLVSYFAEMTLPLHSTLLAFVPWLTTGLFTGAPSPAIGDTKDSRLGCSSSTPRTSSVSKLSSAGHARATSAMNAGHVP